MTATPITTMQPNLILINFLLSLVKTRLFLFEKRHYNQGMQFKYDKDKEIDVFERMAGDGRFNPETARLWTKEFAEVSFEKDCVFLEKQVKLCEDNWKEIESNFLEQMSRFFGRKCEISEEMTCYLVRYTTFPYSIEHGWFMAPLYGSPTDRNRIIMHELIHLFTPQGIEKSLKEAVPVILNDNETFKTYAVDRGNTKDEEEMRLRPLILEMFREGRTYAEIIEKLASAKN